MNTRPLSMTAGRHITDRLYKFAKTKKYLFCSSKFPWKDILINAHYILFKVLKVATVKVQIDRRKTQSITLNSQLPFGFKEIYCIFRILGTCSRGIISFKLDTLAKHSEQSTATLLGFLLGSRGRSRTLFFLCQFVEYFHKV